MVGWVLAEEGVAAFGFGCIVDKELAAASDGTEEVPEVDLPKLEELVDPTCSTLGSEELGTMTGEAAGEKEVTLTSGDGEEANGGVKEDVVAGQLTEVLGAG